MDTLRNAIHNRSWKVITGTTRARVIAIVLIIVVPGGIVVPACYAAYLAIRHSWSR